MNPRDRWIQIVCAVMLALCVGGSTVVAPAVTAEAARAQLTYTDEANAADPPEVAVGIAMGAFRGLFVNYLWLRANKLKEEGKYYEAIELSNAITRLQPRFPRVWAFHAWNMAYNISVATQTAQERWQWVTAGIDLLRNEAIRWNPNETILYKELAWIFLHKIQMFQDDANRYYKRQLAREWTFVLGPPPRLPDDPDEAKQTMVDWLEPVASAPDTLSGVVAAELAAKRSAGEEAPTSVVEELVDKIRKDAGLDLNGDLLRLLGYRLAIDASWFSNPDSASSEQRGAIGEIRNQVTRTLSQNSELNRTLDKLVLEPRYADAWKRLVPFVRKRVLVDHYNMDPRRMQRYTLKFGPLDWRHGASHAVYWSHLGVELGLQRKGTTRFDWLNTDRITVHAIQELFRSGTVFYDVLSDSYFAMISTHFAAEYGKIMKEAALRGGNSQDVTTRLFTLYSEGYHNYLRDVIRIFYNLGRIKEADAYFNEMCTWEGINDHRMDYSTDCALPLADYVWKQTNEDDRMTIPYAAANEVQSSLMEAYQRGILMGDTRAFASLWQHAQLVHAHYFKEHDVNQNVDKDSGRMEEMPRNFADAAGAVFLVLASSLPYPEASQLYTSERISDDLRRIVYDDLIAYFAQYSIPAEVLQGLFPEPAGMEEYRAMREAIRKEQAPGQKEDLQFEQQ
ncbi:MAG: hypothetical protein KDA20_02880 [Phycisphaerales bacterium]|nr:hypothetical protein [Phycisphaerales bacterium]